MISVRNPLYIVQKYESLSHLGQLSYYSTFESEKMWTEKAADAFIFTSLLNASRVAEAEKAQIRVLVFPDEAKLFEITLGDRNDVPKRS